MPKWNIKLESRKFPSLPSAFLGAKSAYHLIAIFPRMVFLTAVGADFDNFLIPIRIVAVFYLVRTGHKAIIQLNCVKNQN